MIMQSGLGPKEGGSPLQPRVEPMQAQVARAYNPETNIRGCGAVSHFESAHAATSVALAQRQVIHAEKSDTPHTEHTLKMMAHLIIWLTGGKATSTENSTY